jgi:hypothetical protein
MINWLEDKDRFRNKECFNFRYLLCQFAPFISNFNPTIIMGEDADIDIDRITKRTESVTNDVKELANIAAECPTCSMRFKEYLQSKQ